MRISAHAALLTVLAGRPPAALAQPAITARVTPAPNASGWNNSEVTITFSCQRASFCPDPVVIEEEGAHLLVTRIAADDSGRQAVVTATVNIDRTPPAVTIAAPADDATSRARRVLVSASAADMGSGIRRATCNGRDAAIRGAAIECSIALQEGINDVIVQVMDAAGNSGSAGVHVLRDDPTSPPIAVVPNASTLVQRETRAVQLVDSIGRQFSGGEWSSSDPAVAAVERDGDRYVVRGINPGVAVITGVWESLVASATFTVSSEPRLRPGTTRWTVPPRAGFTSMHMVHTHATLDGPEMFSIERETGGSQVFLKALTSDPRILWLEAPAIREDEEIVRFLGEEFGGVLLRVDSRTSRSSAIVRVGRPSRGPLWRYESSGVLSQAFAQGSDGTVYVVETMADGFPHFVGIDGATGVVKFRWPIPRTSFGAQPRACGIGGIRDLPVVAGDPTVPNGDVAAFAFVTLDELNDDSACSPQTRRVVRTVSLARVTPSGHRDVRTLNAVAGASEASTPAIRPLLVVPNYDEAVLVPWVVTGSGGRVENRITRVEGSRSTEYTLPFLGEVGIGDDTAYTVTEDGRTLVVFDPVSGSVRYIRHAQKITVLAVTRGGGLITNEIGPTLDENYRPLPPRPEADPDPQH